MAGGRAAHSGMGRNGEVVRILAAGQRLRHIRHRRRKSLRVVAGLAGMSTNTLWRIEQGQRDLDRLSEIVALAHALEIAPVVLLQPIWVDLTGDQPGCVRGYQERR